MSEGMLIVESRPQSPECAAQYRKWYEETHVPEVLALDGFASARLFGSLNDDVLLAIFDLDADVQTAKASLRSAQKSGRLSPPVDMQLKPPPSVRYVISADGSA
jgi:hypothetical protein